MSRQIKFRIYNKKSQKWEEPAPLFALGLDGELIHIYNDDGEYVYQQFTGLTDRYGKEVYEGDILRANYSSRYEIWGGDNFLGWSEEEKDFFRLYEVIFYNGNFTVNCDEYTIILNGFAAKLIYNSDLSSSTNESTVNSQIEPLGLPMEDENYGGFGIIAENLEIVGSIFDNPELLK